MRARERPLPAGATPGPARALSSRGDAAEPWWRGVVYQIYPRSFADSDGDGVGDLPGILARLDHLAGGPDALGVDAVWLSPFYPSPMADFGYDVADHTGVDPLFGELADLDRLVAEAHRRGVRVIVDWVPNHSSDRHPWFVDSRRARTSARRDWYLWRDPAPGGGPPDAARSSFPRAGAAWTYDAPTAQWYRHEFLPAQPDLNWENPEVREAMYATLRFWLDRGVDGFRIDVAHRIPHRWLREVRGVLEEYEDRIAVGEVYLLDQAELVEFLNSGDELHLAHNFVFLRAPWRAEAFRAVVDEFERLTSSDVWPAWCLANHDHSRVATRHSGGDPARGRARARVAAMMLLTLRGTPFLFAGEELGLPDAEIPPEAVVDVDGRDPERAPIPWEPPSVAGAGAGFTSGTPWLPVVAEAEELAAARQRPDPRSALSLYRRLIALRRATPALRDGGQRTLAAGADVLAYLRQRDSARLLVALNLAPAPRTLAIDVSGLPDTGRVLASTDPGRTEGVELALAGGALGPDEGVVLDVAPTP